MEHEALIRLTMEARSPRRPCTAAHGRRRATNWRTVTAGMPLIAAPPPLLAGGAALDAEARAWGLFGQAGRLGWSLSPFRGT